jgi:chromosome partitioning protein
VIVLSVSSLKGGVGKTSVTLGLASAAYSRGVPTLIVDMDPQADVSTGLDIPVQTPLDVADVLAAPKSKLLGDALVPSGWTDKRGRVDVIPGSPRAAEFDRPSLSDRYLRKLREALSRIAQDYRLVIIDTPPSLNGLTRASWAASQRVLIVTEPGLFSVAAADRALRAVDELRRHSSATVQPLGIAVNRVRPNSREHQYRVNELREMFGPLVLSPALPERTVLQQAQGSARPIHAWPGRPAAELATAFDQILDRTLRAESIRGSEDRERTRSAQAPTVPAEPNAVTDAGAQPTGQTPAPESEPPTHEDAFLIALERRAAEKTGTSANSVKTPVKPDIPPTFTAQSPTIAAPAVPSSPPQQVSPAPQTAAPAAAAPGRPDRAPSADAAGEPSLRRPRGNDRRPLDQPDSPADTPSEGERKPRRPRH